MKKYDVIVVGGGIAGLYFLKELKRNIDLSNLKILIIERQSKFGKNIRCAQGVSLRWFKKYVPEYKKYVINEISSFELYNSSELIGTFSKDGEGIIVDRVLFESDLGDEIIKFCDVKFSETFLSVERKNSHYIVNTDKSSYLTKYLIGADGVENRVAKSLNLLKALKLDEIDICAYKVIKHKNIDQEVLRFYYGKNVAPGGYLWVFPQGEDVANVGIGINGNSAIQKTPWDYLNPTIDRVYPGAEILEKHVAAIPTPKTGRPTCGLNFLTVGDAGFGVNPFSRAGIVEALSMSYIAAEKFADAIQHNSDFDAKYVKKYLKAWKNCKGKFYPYLYELKLISKEIDDNDLLGYKKIINSIPENKRTLWRVFRKILLKKPMLLWKMRKFWI